jgi:hypothetical protein
MSIEAMKQALDALEESIYPQQKQHKAITALRQAIEQAEKQERVPESWMGITDNPYCNDVNCNDPNGRAMRWHNKLLDLRKKAALDGLEETSREIEQEPKAWIYEGNLHIFDPTDWAIEPESVQPLYTAPPRKEWVGLTDEEIHKIIDDCTPNEAELEELNDFAKAIFAVEAKLKERNT